MNEPKKLSEAMLECAELGCCRGECTCSGQCKVIRGLLEHIAALKVEHQRAARARGQQLAGMRGEMDRQIATLRARDVKIAGLMNELVVAADEMGVELHALVTGKRS